MLFHHCLVNIQRRQFKEILAAEVQSLAVCSLIRSVEKLKFTSARWVHLLFQTQRTQLDGGVEVVVSHAFNTWLEAHGEILFTFTPSERFPPFILPVPYLLTTVVNALRSAMKLREDIPKGPLQIRRLVFLPFNTFVRTGHGLGFHPEAVQPILGCYGILIVVVGFRKHSQIGSLAWVRQLSLLERRCTKGSSCAAGHHSVRYFWQECRVGL